jgi:hypothetical protein
MLFIRRSRRCLDRGDATSDEMRRGRLQAWSGVEVVRSQADVG